MHGRTSIAFGLVALVAPIVAAQEGLRVTSTMGGTLRRGETTTITWTVTGTNEPVRMLLRNVSPEIGTIEGGDVQIVMTSGGSPNTVLRMVTGVNPGPLLIEHTIEPKRDASAGEIASAFQRELQRIASWLSEAANALPVERTGVLQRRTVPLDDVLDLLDRTEADVRLSLPYRQLMPLQDAITARLENVRRELTGVATAEVMVPGDEILLARVRTEARVRQKEAQSIVAGIVDWFRDLAGGEPIVRVCFRMSPPDGASVAIHAASVPRDRQFAPFVSSLDLYLGRWVFEVRRGEELLSNGVFDLTASPGRVFHCPSRAGQPCGLIEETTETCR
jgi:hypothetical protein